MARSTLETLPPEVRQQVNSLLLAANFTDYSKLTEAVNEVLRSVGFEVSIARSSLARYGKRFEERCELLRMAHEQALYMKEQFADEEVAIAEVSLQVAQGLIFDMMVERGEKLEPKEIGLLTRALADSSRAGIGVKKYQSELKAKVAEKFTALEKSGGIDPEALQRVRQEIYGLF